MTNLMISGTLDNLAADVFALSKVFTALAFSSLGTIFLRIGFVGRSYIDGRRSLFWPILGYGINLALITLFTWSVGYLRPDQLWYPMKISSFQYIHQTYLSPVSFAVLFFSGPLIIRQTTGILLDSETRSMPMKHRILYLIIEPIFEEIIFRHVHLQVLCNFLPLEMAILVSAAFSTIKNLFRIYLVDTVFYRKLILRNFLFTTFYGFLVFLMIGSVYVQNHSIVGVIVFHIFFRWLGTPDTDQSNFTFYATHLVGLVLTLFFTMAQYTLQLYEHDP